MDMTVNEYQRQAASTAQYDGQRTTKGLLYVLMGIAAEAGEVANDGKKIIRGDDAGAIQLFCHDDYGTCSGLRREKLLLELGDVAWYLALAATELNIDLQTLMRMNLNKLAKRAANDNIKGDHNKPTAAEDKV